MLDTQKAYAHDWDTGSWHRTQSTWVSHQHAPHLHLAALQRMNEGGGDGSGDGDGVSISSRGVHKKVVL